MGILLCFLGILVFATSFFVKYQAPSMVSKLKVAGFALFALGAVGSFFVSIDAGKVGVKTLFGNVSNDVLNSGLRIVNPLMKVHEFDIRTQNYTMSGVHNEGAQSGDDAIRVLTADGLEVVVDLSVLYRPVASECPKILSTIGLDYENILIRPLTRTRIRDNAV